MQWCRNQQLHLKCSRDHSLITIDIHNWHAVGTTVQPRRSDCSQMPIKTPIRLRTLTASSTQSQLHPKCSSRTAIGLQYKDPTKLQCITTMKRQLAKGSSTGDPQQQLARAHSSCHSAARWSSNARPHRSGQVLLTHCVPQSNKAAQNKEKSR
jgi:hypothetical protein